MFDGFKIILKNSNGLWKKNDFYRQISIGNDNSELIKNVYKGKEGISFHEFQKSDLVIMHGSFHKFFNQGLHNYNNFNYNNFKNSVNEIMNLYSIKPHQCALQNIEYGLNLEVEYDVNTILDNLLLHENKVPLKPLKTDLRFKHQRYELKIYNKSEQYKMFDIPNNILRFEKRYERMIDLNKHSIYNLNDLLNPNCLNFFNQELIRNWLKVLFYDFTINEKELTKKQISFVKDYKRQSYWNGLKPNRRDRHKKRLIKITKNHSEQIQLQVANLINESLIRNCVSIND